MRQGTVMVIAAAVLLVGCGGPRIEWSNERGGIVTYAGSTEEQAMDVADDHCGKSGRKARVSNLNAADAKVTFDCVK